MAWEVNGEGEKQGDKKITLIRNGSRVPYTFPSDITLMNAVRDIASRNGLTSVNVMENGQELSEEDGKTELYEFTGELTVQPKNTGSRK